MTEKAYKRPSRSKDRPLWARNLENHVVTIWDIARREGHTHAQILARYKPFTDYLPCDRRS